MEAALLTMAVKVNPFIKTYYANLDAIQFHASNEGATRHPFQALLADWSRPFGFTLVGEQSLEGSRKKMVRPDGVLVDSLKLRRGYWEAKDSADSLEKEISKKKAAGYPLSNIIFEDTRQAVLYQDGQPHYSADLRDPDQLQRLLDEFVGYNPPQIDQFHKAVARFKEEIPSLANAMAHQIEVARKGNARFKAAFGDFLELCRTSLNPDTTPAQVEDMLKQHILTERIFRSIFQNPDFVRRNAVAVELEKMVDALTSQSFSRDAFLSGTDFFYRAIEENARTIHDYNEKQALLNALYEQFFQSYSTKTADTHGIVYTPAPIVRWMVASVEKALQNEFGFGMGTPGVHIIDPCVGTGTFMMEILQQLPGATLEQKYRDELHCNEIQLLPYYIASLNIEHAYLEKTGRYESFPGICFADTLDIMDTPQMSMFAPDNSERVDRQKQAPIRVVIGNPPYNAWQENENDNNKNRKHPNVDKRIAETYARASKASNKNALSDVYVKFFRWASDRLGDRDGIVCYVSNNSFLNQIAFDGMRQHLLKDFSRVYVFDLGGNVRKNPKLSGSKHNVFGIQVGVAITILIRNRQHTTPEIHYARLDEFWTKEHKLDFLAAQADYTQTAWQPLTPDARNTWLTEGLKADFDAFMPIGSKEAKGGSLLSAETIFKTYSNGVKTNRDEWAYAFHETELARKIQFFIENYNTEVDRWRRRGSAKTNLDEFIQYDDKALKWSGTLKANLERGKYLNFDPHSIRKSLYRPFCSQFLYFDRTLNERVYLFPAFFPTPATEQENSVICVSGIGSSKPFQALVSGTIPSLDTLEKTQCFPLYTYSEDGSERRDNITDWALEQFRQHYGDPAISKPDLFHYVYAVLHAPDYRATYAENLKRDLPHIPLVGPESFWAYVRAGEGLARLHRDYLKAEPYPLRRQETPGLPFSWLVDEKGMRLSADKTSLRYNDSLSLLDLPAKVFEYRLGNRSALEWVIDQYRVSQDHRSGLRHDPNDPADPPAIVRLVEQVVRVSLDSLALIEGLGQ